MGWLHGNIARARRPPHERHPGAAPSQSRALPGLTFWQPQIPLPASLCHVGSIPQPWAPASRNCCCSATSGRLWDGMVSTAPLRTEAGDYSRPAGVWHPGSLWNDNPLARSFRDQKTSETSHREEEGKKGAFRPSCLQRTQLSSLAVCLVQRGFPWQFCDVHTFKSPASYFYGGFRQVESLLKVQSFSNCHFFEEFWWNGNILSLFPISYSCSGIERIPLHNSMTITGDSHQCSSAESKSPMLTDSNF